MKVLVGCEFSGIVRECFEALGHNAISCDLEETEIKGRHIRGDLREQLLNTSYNLAILFPPCTHLCVSGAKHFKRKELEQEEAIYFFMACVNSPIQRIAIENPIGIMSTHYRKPDQTIQPWQFGHGETKATCLWLKNLPLLVLTFLVQGREQKVHLMPPSADRSKNRSRTYLGIARAMAYQWGILPPK